MNIAVIGLGLIGGSFCRTLKRTTHHTVLGLDLDKHSIQMALAQKAIDRKIDIDQLGEADLTIICLYPKQTIAFIEDHANCFKQGSIVMDSCGIKHNIVQPAHQALSRYGVRFVGVHPMAGREFSGFSYSTDHLFDNASLIITQDESTDQEALATVQKLATILGFSQIVTTDPMQHDRVIAFTSQLAHVVSNAYMKSPTAQFERGFTGGSFQDLTRVAMLNDSMWTELFSLNRTPLLHELDTLLVHLTEYRDALQMQDHTRLQQLLFEGSELKKQDLKNNK